MATSSNLTPSFTHTYTHTHTHTHIHIISFLIERPNKGVRVVAPLQVDLDGVCLKPVRTALQYQPDQQSKPVSLALQSLPFIFDSFQRRQRPVLTHSRLSYSFFNFILNTNIGFLSLNIQCTLARVNICSKL
jgi:hypothetical protein